MIMGFFLLMKAILRIIIIICFFSLSISAQYYFGKNKIQYADYDWKRLRTEHFDIYFFGEEERLARITAREAETDWEDLVGKFRFVPRERIPVIIYPAPNLFQETNTIPWILPEGVGGFTEYYKGRVVLPFNGRYRDFRHTLKHELVHAFIMHKNIFVHDAHELFFIGFLPLWFEEGMAEHLSERTSDEMEMVVRSAALEGDFVPLSRIYDIYGSFKMYKETESFLDWLADEYGDCRIPLVIGDMHDYRFFDELFEAHFGISLDEAGDRWENYIHEKYWPMITEGELPDETGEVITSKKDGTHLSPIAYTFKNDSLPSVLLQSSRMGYPGIYKLRGGKYKLIIKGGFEERLEQMHLYQNGFSISDNGVIALSVKVKGGDILTFVEAERGDILAQRRFDEIPGISDPQIDREAKRVTFSGTGLNGFADIFVFHIETDSIDKLTDDIYGDFHPVFAGDYIIFSSDRVERGDADKLSICRIPVEGGNIDVLGGLSGNNVQPSAHRDGRISFSSNHGTGIQNIWLLDPDSSRAYRVTNILTGLFEPSEWRGDSVLATVYTNTSYQVILMPCDTVYEQVETEWVEWEKTWEPREMHFKTAKGRVGYDTKLSFDIAQGAIATNTSMESAGGIEGIFSDMLGDRHVYFLVYDQFGSFSDILKNLNVAAIYYDMQDRPIWGTGGFHFYTEGYNRFDFGFSEETFGALGTVSYPFSRFMRIESTGYLTYSEKSYFADLEPERKGWFGTLNLSLIRDNSLWGRTGPIEGFRGNATVGGTYRFDTGQVSSHLASADLRYYLRLTKRSAFATRLVGRSSGGPEPERFWMGGTWDFRGYPFFYFYGKNIVFASTELRFPVFDQFRVKFPFLDANFHGINGALFFDMGQAWEDEPLPLLGSVGTGLRMNLGYVTVLRFDVAWRTEFEGRFEKPYYDIFFGWDF